MTEHEAPLVLVVDDEPVLLRALVRLVQRDRPALGVRSMAEALAAVRARGSAIAWILCDVRLGIESGLDLWDALADLAPPLRPRVSFMTGGNVPPQLGARLERSGCATLLKPVEPAVLRAHLIERLGAPASPRA